MKTPLRLLIAVLAGLCAAGLTAAEIVAGPVVGDRTNGTATIRWATDVATGTRVLFGPSPDQMTRRVEGEVAKEHAVQLTGLKPGTRYFFAVGTARVVFRTNSFTTPGSAVEGKPTAAAPKTKSAASRAAPPTREIWGNLPSLQDHFDRHGRDFGAKSPDDYARMAWEFLQRGRAEGLPMKVDEEGVLRVFDPKTRTFGAYNRDGTAKTFFKPESRDYFDRHPGRLVQSKTAK